MAAVWILVWMQNKYKLQGMKKQLLARRQERDQWGTIFMEVIKNVEFCQISGETDKVMFEIWKYS